MYGAREDLKDLIKEDELEASHSVFSTTALSWLVFRRTRVYTQFVWLRDYN